MDSNPFHSGVLQLHMTVKGDFSDPLDKKARFQAFWAFFGTPCNSSEL